MAELVLKKIVKNYGAVNIIKGMDLAVNQGEFISFLGPSGCGKSTLLSMIAGLETPSSGQILFQGKLLSAPTDRIWVEPEHRNFGIVFQSYALWPHMTVEQNLAFPLGLRKMAKIESRRRIGEIIELVELQGLERRYPGQLSGGQQQRVALARALVYHPQLLLLDEPLSNLDATLRDQARIWLKEIQLRLGITTIYVTHDQSEALTMSDRIVVMRQGFIEQMGKPKEIYEQPANSFVASFVGAANFLTATVTKRAGDEVEVMFADAQKVQLTSTHAVTIGERVKVALRPEQLYLDRARVASQPNELRLIVGRTLYRGSSFSYDCDLAGETVHVSGDMSLDPGATVFYFSPSSAMIFADD